MAKIPNAKYAQNEYQSNPNEVFEIILVNRSDLGIPKTKFLNAVCNTINIPIESVAMRARSNKYTQP